MNQAKNSFMQGVKDAKEERPYRLEIADHENYTAYMNGREYAVKHEGAKPIPMITTETKYIQYTQIKNISSSEDVKPLDVLL